MSTSAIAPRRISTELSPLFDREQLENVVDDFVAMELFLQKLLMQLSGLLVATNGEWTGLFPQDVYRSVLGSAQSILDLLTAMRTLTTTEAWMTHVRRDFVIPVNQERREMVRLRSSLTNSMLILESSCSGRQCAAAVLDSRLVGIA